MHAIEECLGGLGSIEVVRVFRPPRFELNTLPALGKVLLKNRQCVLQRSPTQHVRIEVATAVRVRAEDSPSELLLEVLEGLNVAAVEFDLERRLLSIARKRSLAHDKPHGVAQAELVHARSYSLCHLSTRWHDSPSGSGPVRNGPTTHLLGFYRGGDPDRNCHRAVTLARTTSWPASTGTDSCAVAIAASIRIIIGRGGGM